MESEELLRSLTEILARQLEEKERYYRDEKQRRILLSLARGAMLVVLLAAPGSGKVLKHFIWEKSNKESWKVFNKTYLRRAIKRLEKKKIVEIEEKDGVGVVKLTDKGRGNIFKFGLEELKIPKPDKWDGKWRVVIYDVLHGNKTARDKLRNHLLKAGFYPLQKSVFLHAYPCQKEVEFLRYYLGVGGEVRFITAQGIENDEEFRLYFGVQTRN